MTKKKKNKLIVGLSGAFVLSLLFLVLQNFTFYQSIETFSLDLRYRYFNRETPFPKDVVIVDVDDESLKNLGPQYGRWPWPRRVYKEVIEHIASGEPKSIIFDFLFTEEQKDTDDDLQMAEASEMTGLVSHSYFFLKESTNEDAEFRPLNSEIKSKLKLNFETSESFTKGYVSYKDYLLPNATLFSKTPFVHAVNVEPDNDGLLRKVPLLVYYQNEYIPSLSFRGVLSTLNKPKVVRKTREQMLVYDDNKLKYKIPINEKGELSLHFYNPKQGPDSYHFSALIDSRMKILEGENPDPALFINPEVFKDKVVIIGASAMGLNDLKVTPLSNQYPGSYLHATSVANILKGDYLKKSKPWVDILIVILLIFILEMTIFLSESIIVRNSIPVLMIGGYFALALFEFKYNSFYLPINSPLLFGFACFIHGFTYIAFVEGKARKKMESALSKYLSPTVTQNLIDSGIDPSAEVGTHKELTVLFSDIRGFTTMSEKMEPKKLVAILNEYLGKMTDIVFEHSGTLDKFIGDAVMAFWGAPLDDEKHAYNAVKTALHMIDALEKLNKGWTQAGLSKLKIGIGIHTGKVIVGNIGGAKRLDYTVIGDNVNTTSRLEGLTKEYQVDLVVSETTYNLLKDKFVFRPIDNVVAKGKTQALRLYEPLYELNTSTQDQTKLIQSETIAKKFTLVWELYNEGKFKESLTQFETLRSEFPFDGPTEVYIERCKDLIANPPQDWTGVFKATKK